MTAKKFLIAIAVLSLGLFVQACVSPDKKIHHPEPEVNPYAQEIAELIAEGKHLLTIGQTVAAEDKFKEVFDYDENNGEARFGVILANNLSLVDFTTSIFSLALQLKSTAPLQPQTEPTRAEYVFGMIDDFIKEIQLRMQYLRGETELLLQTDPEFTFYIDELVLYVFMQPAANLRGIYTKREATLLLASFEGIESMLSFLRSQELTVNIFNYINEAMNLADSGDDSSSSAFGDISELLAKILDENPSFLDLKQEEGSQLYHHSREMLIASIEHLLAGIDLYRNNPDASTSLNNIIYLEVDDTTDDESLVFDNLIRGEEGESLWLDLINTDPEIDTTDEDPYVYSSVGVPLSEDLLTGIEIILDNLNGDVERINLSYDMVPMLANLLYVALQFIDFEELVGEDFPIQMISPVAIELVLNTFIPNIFEFDLATFMGTPVAFRDLLPAWNENGLLIEWECDTGSDGYPDGSYGAICENSEAADDWTDSGHFIGTAYELAEDGIYFATPIIAFQDPTFNGLLYIDLYPLDIEGYDDPQGFEAANGAHLNAIFGWLFDLVADYL
jgi:hypothetical protein